MRALVLAGAVVLATQAHVGAYENFVSPDKKFEAYTTQNADDGTGMKLFLRRAGARDTGLLLWQNGRWVDAKWSPDSQFLAVIDHMDGHIADVYVFGVTAVDAGAPPTATLFYHTPNLRTYDVKWEIVGWHPNTREVILRQEVHDQNAGTHATNIVTAKIGTESLKLD